MRPEYEDFIITVSGTPGSYLVAAQGPENLRAEPSPFILDQTAELELELNRIKMGFAPSRDRMQKVGELLFKALFPPYTVSQTFAEAKRNLKPGVNLRIKLIIRPPELSHLPWEITYSLIQRSFLATRRTTPIVRFIEGGSAAASLLTHKPLQVLYVQANPAGTQKLDSGASEQALRTGLGAHGQVTVVHQTTPAALRDKLRESTYHILHYDGHGAFSDERGHLYLHDEAGAAHKLSDEMLATYLDGTSIRLVVLSACETAAASSEKRFSGIAGQLMRTTDLPAVVAMQYEIPDHSATAFTREFYRALAEDDFPVDAAVVEGRKAILEALGDDEFAAPDWATPVLYLRVADGDIFKTQGKETTMTDPKEEKSVDTGGGAFIAGGVNTGGGDFVGRDKVTTYHGVSGSELESLFTPLMEAVKGAAPEKQAEAQEKAKRLKEEVAKGDQADDTKMAKLIDGLVGLIPDGVKLVTGLFASPVVGGLAGNATKFVLDKLRGE